MFHLRNAYKNSDFKDQHRDAVRDALPALLHVFDAYIDVPRFDASIGTGLAGLGEAVLTAGVVLEEERFHDRSLTLAQTLIDRYSEPSDWPTGTACGGPNPSLWLGTAGIGWWLLRVDDPAHIPCCLLLDPIEEGQPACELRAEAR